MGCFEPLLYFYMGRLAQLTPLWADAVPHGVRKVVKRWAEGGTTEIFLEDIHPDLAKAAEDPERLLLNTSTSTKADQPPLAADVCGGDDNGGKAQ